MSEHQLSVFQSGIRDNRDRGTVGDFLKDKIEPGSKLSIVSAYFTIYAFEALKVDYLATKYLGERVARSFIEDLGDEYFNYLTIEFEDINKITKKNLGIS